MRCVTQTPAQALTVEISLTDPPTTVRLDTLLHGRTFTHLLTEPEIERDVLAMTPDFAAIWPMIGIPPYDRVNGLSCEDAFDETLPLPQGVLQLAPGSLGEFSVGELIGITVADDGLQLRPAPEPDDLSRTLMASAFLRETDKVFDNDVRRDLPSDLPGQESFLDDEVDLPDPTGSVALEELLQLGCLRNAQLFVGPSWPVATLLEDLELDHDHGQVAAAGFDFDAEAEMFSATGELSRIAETYELSDEEAAAVLAFTDKIDEVHDAIHDWTDAGRHEKDFPEMDVDEVLMVLPTLAEPMVAVGIADENLGGDRHLASVLQLILLTVRPQVPRRAAAAWHWLTGRCADALSDFTGAEAGYNQALADDADFYPAMRELATLVSLRGDANRAVSLLQRAGVPSDDPELILVSRYIGESRGDLGRNDPCWCGSGRKYKRCHLGRSDFDLPDRRDWLYHKVSAWALNGAGRELVIELAAAAVDPADGPEQLFATVLDPTMTDVALFEGGLLQEFIESRALQLPADEQDLLALWRQTRRVLCCVESVDLGTHLTLRDVSTGTVFGVADELAEVKPGDLVCLHPLPPGDLLIAPGGLVVVSPGQRELTLAMLSLQDTDDADPIRTVSVLAGRSAAAQNF